MGNACAGGGTSSVPSPVRWEGPTTPNVAPTQQVAVVRQTDAGRECVMLRWGLVPSWADDIKIGVSLLNARAETVATKPAFRTAFKKRRCLVLADGYYEWSGPKGKKQPHWYRLKDESVFAFAGLWEHWRRGEQVVDSCTLVTTEANELARQVHDRMPVILGPEVRDAWLDPEVEEPEALQELLRPYPADLMRVDLVNPIVNNSRNETPACIEPAA